MNVSRALFTHSRQNGTLAESRSEEGSLTGSSEQPDTWRIPHSSTPFQPGTHTDRAITARGEGPQPAVFRPICCVSVRGRDRRGGGRGELSKDSLPIEPELRSKNERVAHHGTTPLTTDVNVCWFQRGVVLRSVAFLASAISTLAPAGGLMHLDRVFHVLQDTLGLATLHESEFCFELVFRLFRVISGRRFQCGSS